MRKLPELWDACECKTRTVWQPSCSGQIRGVNKLIKYEVTKKVPTYKWVVEYCCNQCCCEMTEEARRDDRQIAVESPPAVGNPLTKNTAVKSPRPPPENFEYEPSKLRPTDEPESHATGGVEARRKEAGGGSRPYQKSPLPDPWKLLFKKQNKRCPNSADSHNSPGITCREQLNALLRGAHTPARMRAMTLTQA